MKLMCTPEMLSSYSEKFEEVLRDYNASVEAIDNIFREIAIYNRYSYYTEDTFMMKYESIRKKITLFSQIFQEYIDLINLAVRNYYDSSDCQNFYMKCSDFFS